MGRSLKHLFWRYLGQRQCLPHPCLRQMLPNAGLGLVLLNACLRLVLSHLSFLLPVVCCMPNGGGGLDWWHDALAHALSAFFASCFLCLLRRTPITAAMWRGTEAPRLSAMATVALLPPRLPFTSDFVAARVPLCDCHIMSSQWAGYLFVTVTAVAVCSVTQEATALEALQPHCTAVCGHVSLYTLIVALHPQCRAVC